MENHLSPSFYSCHTVWAIIASVQDNPLCFEVSRFFPLPFLSHIFSHISPLPLLFPCLEILLCSYVFFSLFVFRGSSIWSGHVLPEWFWPAPLLSFQLSWLPFSKMWNAWLAWMTFSMFWWVCRWGHYWDWGLSPKVVRMTYLWTAAKLSLGLVWEFVKLAVKYPSIPIN